MSFIIPRLKTQAESELEAQFAGLLAPSLERRAAFAQFAASGLPNKRVEAWHFTDLRAVMDVALPLATRGKGALHKPSSILPKACVIALVDGVYSPEHSDILPDGVRIVANQPLNGTSDAVLALNHAFAEHPITFEIAAKAQVLVPLQIASMVSAGALKSVFSRVSVRIGAGAKVSLVESADGLEGAHQVNMALDISLEDGAICSHIADFAAGQSVLVNSLTTSLGKDANLQSFALLSGGTLVRRQMFVVLAGRGGNVTLDGVHLGRGHEHIDTSLVMEHKAAHCISRETFRTILDGEATGVYQGKVIVHPGAQKSDAKMMSKAVLLSDNAVMDNKPELEIFADDVVCGHGATVGALDEDQIFYCAARGIAKPQAEALLLQAFAGELIENLSEPAAQPHMMKRVEQWLNSRHD